MFYYHKDICSLGFQFFLKVIHIAFNIVHWFEIEPKPESVGNVKVRNKNNKEEIQKWNQPNINQNGLKKNAT